MLSISIWETLIRGIPESFLFLYFAFLYTGKSMEKKKMIIATILFALSGYVIRKLPIHLGINTILSLVTFIAISNLINDIPLSDCITLGLFLMILILASEGMNIILFQIFKVNTKEILNTPFKKLVYTSPSLIFFGVFGYFGCKVFSKNKGVN